MASEQSVEESPNFEASHYISTMLFGESIAKFCAGKKLSSTGKEEDLITECCKLGEPVCMMCPRGVKDESTYMYVCLFEDLKIQMSFTSFESQVLIALNVTPTQLHPNSWGFIRGFEILCRALKLDPKVTVFFAFYRTNGEGLGKWISFSNHAKRRLLTPFTTSYKEFKV